MKQNVLVVRICGNCEEVVVVDLADMRCPNCSHEGYLCRLAYLSREEPPGREGAEG